MNLNSEVLSPLKVNKLKLPEKRGQLNDNFKNLTINTLVKDRN